MSTPERDYPEGMPKNCNVRHIDGPKTCVYCVFLDKTHVVNYKGVRYWCPYEDTYILPNKKACKYFKRDIFM